MHRLFVALRPPAVIRDRLVSTNGGVPGARWQTDEQIHLTLRFIGTVDRRQADDVATALGNVHVPPFAIALDGCGRFGEGSRSGSLWIGVSPHAPLVALHKKVEQACRRAGLPPEGRAYLPHITVARLARGAGPADAFLSANAALTSEPFVVDSFGLYESTLGGEGATYTLAERYRLG